jgi:hypothetical protein
MIFLLIFILCCKYYSLVALLRDAVMGFYILIISRWAFVMCNGSEDIFARDESYDED